MKDHVEIGHLAKYGAFRVNRDQVMDLETWFKIHTGVSNFEKLNILSKSRYNVDLILVVYYISAGQTSLLQVQ